MANVHDVMTYDEKGGCDEAGHPGHPVSQILTGCWPRWPALITTKSLTMTKSNPVCSGCPENKEHDNVNQ